jgi:DNA-binding CsgD family transcriptional regulator
VSELSRSEYEGMLHLAETALNAERHEDWWQVATELTLGPLFHADVCTVAEVDHRHLSGQFFLVRPAWAERAAAGSEMQQELLVGHPFSPFLGEPGGFAIVRITDLISSGAWRQTAAYAKMQELIGATNQLGIAISIGSGRSISLSPIRAGSNFTEHEVLVAERLQPLLRSADRHVRSAIQQRAGLSSDEQASMAEAAAELMLTRREQVVLGTMADGLTTAAIGRKLGVSARTVSKHQENIYRKLGASNRPMAMVRAQQAGLLRPLPLRLP